MAVGLLLGCLSRIISAGNAQPERQDIVRHSIRRSVRAWRWIGAAALLFGSLIWLPWLGLESRGAGEPVAAASPAAGGTPAAAASPLASPAASPVPTAPLGVPVPYGDAWTITGIDASLTPMTPFATPEGAFLIVTVSIENRDAAPRGFPFDDLRLEVDGELTTPDFGATNTTGTGYFQSFPPGQPQETAIVFDVPAGAAGSFVLQSSTDPDFGILVRQERLAAASPVTSPAPLTMGMPVAYGDGWTITATDLSLEADAASLTPHGVFAVVTITIENTRRTPRHFPVGDLRLESAGILYALDLDATNRTGNGVYQRFPTDAPQATVIVFDLPANALGPFILQSVSDPAFRILVDLPRRG